MPEDSSGGNAKAFGGVVAILAIIAGVYAMVQPMRMQIDYQQKEVSEMRKVVDAGVKHQGHIAAELASLKTASEDTEARLARIEDWLEAWNQTVPAIDATQDQRLKTIEENMAQWHQVVPCHSQKDLLCE